MLNVYQFRKLIADTLQDIGLYSEAAVELLLGTAIQESKLTYLYQMGGPALGLFEIEPPTYDDLAERVRKEYKLYKLIVAALNMVVLPPATELAANIKLGIIFARLKYYYDPNPLPTANDIDGLAAYYKRVYNTPLGAATIEQFKTGYLQYAHQH